MNMKEDLKVGAQLRNLRQRSDISLRQLSKMADVSVSYLSAIEKDTVSPTLATLRKVLIALGTNFYEFFNDEKTSEEKYFFRKAAMRTVTDSDREYTCILPLRDDIKFELMDEIYIEGKNLPEFETLENDFAGYVVSGNIILEIGDQKPTQLHTGDAFYVPEGTPVRGYCTSGQTARLITALSPALKTSLKNIN